MERNKKYHSNHYSQVTLPTIVTNKDHLFRQSKIHTISNNLSNYESGLYSSKQNSFVPIRNQYSYLNKFKKIDRFLDMENYFHNLYGRKQSDRHEKIQKEKEEKQKLILPSILQKKNQMSFQQQLLKVKLQHMEERLRRLEPLQVIDYNRLPPINHNCQCSCGGNHNYNNNYPHHAQQKSSNQIQQSRKKLTKEQRKKVLRKFRIYGYAVYFAIIFPHYSFLFGHFKLKDFLQKYLVEDNKMIKKMNEIVIQKFKQIPLYQDIRNIHQEYDQNKKKLDESSVKQKQQDPKIKISNEGSNETYIVNLNIFKQVIMHIISIFENIIDQFDEDMYEFFSIGTLNTSYYGDEIYAIEEMPFLFLHPDKGNVILNAGQEKALLLSNFIIKKVVYQYLVRLAVDPEWHQELASFSTLKKKQVAFFKLICKELQLCSFFLYELSIKNFYSLIESDKIGNFLDQSDSSLPLPLKTMRFPSLFMSQSQKQLFNHGFDTFLSQSLINPGSKQKSKNIISNQSVEKFQSKYNWNQQESQIFQQYTLLIEQDPLNLVHNNFQFGQLSKIIGQYMKSSYQKAQKAVIKVITKLRQKVHQKRKKKYQKIHQKILKKNYILTKQHQILQGIIFLRNSQQRKQVSIGRRMLEIYMEVLAKQQIQTKGHLSQLTSKRQMLLRRNQTKSFKSNKSIISFVSSQKNSKKSQ